MKRLATVAFALVLGGCSLANLAYQIAVPAPYRDIIDRLDACIDKEIKAIVSVTPSIRIGDAAVQALIICSFRFGIEQDVGRAMQIRGKERGILPVAYQPDQPAIRPACYQLPAPEYWGP